MFQHNLLFLAFRIETLKDLTKQCRVDAEKAGFGKYCSGTDHPRNSWGTILQKVLCTEPGTNPALQYSHFLKKLCRALLGRVTFTLYHAICLHSSGENPEDMFKFPTNIFQFPKKTATRWLHSHKVPKKNSEKIACPGGSFSPSRCRCHQRTYPKRTPVLGVCEQDGGASPVVWSHQIPGAVSTRTRDRTVNRNTSRVRPVN